MVSMKNDWDNWVKLTKKIGDRCQLVGDDLFVTNVKFLEKGIKMGAAKLYSYQSKPNWFFNRKLSKL